MNSWHIATWYRDAWPRLPAFVIPGFSDAQIRINLAGRERDGIVARDDYHRACDDVERVLRACRDGATGASIVRAVDRVRADDPFAPDGPPADLIVQLEGADAIEHPDLGPVGPVVAARTGGHTANGFAFLAGAGIAPGPRGEFAVCDLSATLVDLLGTRSVAPLEGRQYLSTGLGAQ
jgi:predicted AlkP superfamily phosphohydrolase/phosphomutase